MNNYNNNNSECYVWFYITKIHSQMNTVLISFNSALLHVKYNSVASAASTVQWVQH